jgi:hypothetical protein
MSSMGTRRSAWVVGARAAAALVLLIAAGATVTNGAANAAPAAPNEVTKWNRIAANTLVAFPGPAGGAPPALQINMAMTQGAVYDAVNAIEPRRRPHLLATRFDPMASKEAAAATAAYRVLSSIVSTVPETIPFPNRASLLQMLGTEYATSLARYLTPRTEPPGSPRGTPRRTPCSPPGRATDASGRHSGCRTMTPGTGSQR